MCLLLAAVMISCGGDDADKTGVFEVTLAGQGVDCKLMLIDFKTADAAEVAKITGASGARYHAFNFDKNRYSQIGLVVTVTVRRTTASEMYACTTVGPAFPWVTVIKAEIK